jgi:hypothetical protein
MGRMKEQWKPTTKKKKCVRNKYSDREKVVRSSFALTVKTGEATREPEFCGECNAWHINYSRR